MKYTFIVVETLRKEFEIEADDIQEAYQQGKKNYNSGQLGYFLTDEDFVNVDFHIKESEEDEE